MIIFENKKYVQSFRILYSIQGENMHKMQLSELHKYIYG